MLVHVASLLRPFLQATLRSAGQSGYHMFEELVVLRCVPMYAEVDTCPLNVIEGPSTAPVNGRSLEEFNTGIFDNVVVILDTSAPSTAITCCSCFENEDNSSASTSYDLCEHHTIVGSVEVLDILGSGEKDFSSASSLPYIHFYAGLLMGSKHLVELRAYLLHNITTIGDNFMDGCIEVEIAHLSGLCMLQTIGSDFMFGCVSLKSVEIDDLEQIVSIGDRFLAGCQVLTMVKLAGLDCLTSIGRHFMAECRNLSSLALEGLMVAVDLSDPPVPDEIREGKKRSRNTPVVIGQSFLAGCTGLAFPGAVVVGVPDLDILMARNAAEETEEEEEDSE